MAVGECSFKHWISLFGSSTFSREEVINMNHIYINFSEHTYIILRCLLFHFTGFNFFYDILVKCKVTCLYDILI